jgi:tetratricopeptide (TPR) repeat protein
MTKFSVIGAVLAAVVWGYVAVGPRGLLTRPGRSGLALPQQSQNAQGAASAMIDLGVWRESCDLAGLPLFPDPNGVEYEPLRRLIEASERWALTGDGDELGRMGQIALALELHEPARDFFAAARELGSEKEKWSYFLGAECQQLGDLRAAIEALESARLLEPDYGTTSARLGALYFELGELEKADENYAMAAGTGPFPSLGLVGRGRVALAQRGFDEALKHLDAALRLTPRDFLAHRLRSQSLAGLGRMKEAAAASRISNELPAYRGWLTFDPRLGEAHQLASTQRSIETTLSMAIARGDLPAAAVAGEELLGRLPNSPQILAVVARVVANTGDLPRALELARRAADLAPDNLKAQAALADVAIGAKDFELGQRATKAMIKLAPEDATGYQLLARLYYAQGRPEESIVELRRAISLEPQSARQRLMLVDVLRRSERLMEAEHELEELLVIEPENLEARKALQALRSR